MKKEEKSISRIAVVESDTGREHDSSVFVNFTKINPTSPAEKKYKKIAVLGTKKVSGRDLAGEIITDKSTVTDDINEIDELNFVGSIAVWNGSISEDLINQVKAYADTLVILSGASAGAIGQDFGDLIVWLTDDQANTQFDAWVKNANRGAMIDPEKKGKLLYALSSLLYPETLPYTANIQKDSFKGIIDLALSKNLDDMGYSYWFKATNRTWPRGLWLGGQQARTVYADASVRYDVVQAVSTLVGAGLTFTDDNLGRIKTEIINAISQNGNVESFDPVSIPVQKDSDKVRGVVVNVQVTYKTANEVRTVEVIFGGNV